MTAEPVTDPATAVAADGGPDAPPNLEPSTESEPEPEPRQEPSVLESRYRALLRLLPRGYREVREDEMVDAFLAGQRDTDPENFDLALKHGRPNGAEARAVVALALRARWGETVAPERFAVRRAGLRTALLMTVTVIWTITVANLCWWAWSLALPRVAGGVDVWGALFGLPVGSWQWFEQWSLLAWLPTLPLVLFAGRAGARWAAACAAVPLVVGASSLVRHLGWTGPMWPGYLAPVLIDAAVAGGLLALGLARPGSAAPATRTARAALPRRAARAEQEAQHPARYLVAAGAAVLALNVPSALLAPGVLHISAAGGPYPASVYALLFFFNDEAALWCWAAVVAALWLMVRQLRRGTVGAASLLALSVFAGVATLHRLLASVGSLSQWGNSIGAWWNAALITQFVLAATICVIGGILAARRLHRLPAPAYLPSLR